MRHGRFTDAIRVLEGDLALWRGPVLGGLRAAALIIASGRRVLVAPRQPGQLLGQAVLVVGQDVHRDEPLRRRHDEHVAHG